MWLYVIAYVLDLTNTISIEVVSLDNMKKLKVYDVDFTDLWRDLMIHGVWTKNCTCISISKRDSYLRIINCVYNKFH